MARKGWSWEYKCKKKLIDEYGEINVLKPAFWQWKSDFLILKKGRIIKAIECKKTQKSKWYPNQREIEQFKKLKEFCHEHGIECEYWIKEGRNEKVLSLDEVEKKYFS